MARPSRLTIAKKDILGLFDASAQRVYSDAELARILNEQRSFWRLTERTTVGPFIAFLKQQDKFKDHTFHAAKYNRKITRYSWGDASIYELAQAIYPRGYFSHATAVALHGLTDLIPQTIYLNVEQSPKPAPRGPLTQRGIDQAFARRQRQSNMTYAYEDWSVTILNGKNTGALGVEDIIGPNGEKVRATNLERTLIDIVVRPTYSGGIFQVLEAYRRAEGRVSTNRLTATLKKLDYKYPYHQAIGFLMDLAGYEEKRYSLLSRIGLNHDFYLTHGMEAPKHSSKWRLFYPSGLDG